VVREDPPSFVLLQRSAGLPHATERSLLDRHAFQTNLVSKAAQRFRRAYEM
jgi:hypothetical protein